MAKNRELEDLQRSCRFYRHAWEITMPGADWKLSGRFIESRFVLHLRCLRCNSERHDGFDSRGDLIARRYDMVEGYHMSADERPSTMELRLWMVRRTNARFRRTAKVG